MFPAFVFDIPVLLFGSIGKITCTGAACIANVRPLSMVASTTRASNDDSRHIKTRVWGKDWRVPETSISPEDMQYLTSILGYRPWNALSVANRTSSGKPAVLECYPLVPSKKGPQPFPTTFWLCDPDANNKVSALEYVGTIVALKERLVGNSEYFEEMKRCHQAYADERWALLSDSDKLGIQKAGWENRLRRTGIGGMRPEGFVKCLHIHYAHYLARSADFILFFRLHPDYYDRLFQAARQPGWIVDSGSHRR